MLEAIDLSTIEEKRQLEDLIMPFWFYNQTNNDSENFLERCKVRGNQGTSKENMQKKNNERMWQSTSLVTDC